MYSKKKITKKLSRCSPFCLPDSKQIPLISPSIEYLLGLKKLDSFYRARPKNLSVDEFLRYTLNCLNVKTVVASGSVQNIPKSGPLIIVANHPFGGIEGMMLAELLLKQRKDVKVLANNFLQNIPELDDLFIGVDVFGGDSSRQMNMKPLKQSILHLKKQGVVIIFPAGQVSNLSLATGQISDRKWNRVAGLLVRKSAANIIPVFIEGSNSRLFHYLGLLHPYLRTSMLIREMLEQKGKTISFHFGPTISSGQLKGLDSDEAITQYLRLNTYLMARPYRKTENNISPSGDVNFQKQDIAPSTGIDGLKRDINQLKKHQLLITSDQFQVFYANSQELEAILPEIGRLREISFRATGEGSGLARDLDEYDQHYLHLFIWDNEKYAIVGAYRFGLVDQILETKGIKGLYSKSLYHFDEQFIRDMTKDKGYAIEMGRSFICPEYQRNKNSLLLLWKGISEFVFRFPQYNTLYGPVSISNDYSRYSRALITRFLEIHHFDDSKAKKISPVKAQQIPERVFWTQEMLSMVSDNKLISRLVQRMEGDKGIPIILRQYLSLNGKLVCFNVDKNFNYSLAGLIIVDLYNVPEKVLGRYMGTEKAQHYLATKKNS